MNYNYKDYNFLITRKKELAKEIKKLEKSLRALPEGHLDVGFDKGYPQYYLAGNNNHPKYIRKKDNRELIDRLIMKEYLSRVLRMYENEKDAIDSFYTIYSESAAESVDNMFDPVKGKAFRSTLLKQMTPQAEAVEDWITEEYQTNPNYPEALKLKTLSGKIVRSKSEVIIADALFRAGIPFRYECRLELGGIELYPDFTILDSRTMEVKYWEHHGLMDNVDYISNTIMKQNTYYSHGIIPSINMITTYETADAPLDTNWVETLIRYHFPQ